MDELYEKWYVLTYRDYDFEDGGRQVKGRSLHCYRPSNEAGWPGVEYAKISVPVASPAFSILPVLGEQYGFAFDKKGKVKAMIPVEA